MLEYVFVWMKKKNHEALCYIMTVDMDFGFLPGDPVYFDKQTHCDLKTGGRQCVEIGQSSRCVTGRRPSDMRTT